MENKPSSVVFLALTRPKYKWGMPYYYAIVWMLANTYCIWLTLSISPFIPVLTASVSWAIGHLFAVADPDLPHILWTKAFHGKARFARKFWNCDTYDPY